MEFVIRLVVRAREWAKRSDDDGVRADPCGRRRRRVCDL